MPASSSDERLVAKFAILLPQLDERQRRLLLGAEARELGRGGIARVAAAAGVSRPTVSRGISEIATGADGGAGAGRIRRSGGGRKSLTETDPGLLAALDVLVEPDNRGDPMSPLRWTTKSTRNLADALTADGHPVSHMRVGELLHASGYSLQGNLKSGRFRVLRGFGLVLTRWSAAVSGCARHRFVPPSAGTGSSVGGGSGRAVGG
jgi:hypothetical protein